MKIIVCEDHRDILFKKVFAHSVYKQTLLYQYKVNGITDFTLSGPEGILKILKEKVSEDCDLESLSICYLSSDPVNPRPCDPALKQLSITLDVSTLDASTPINRLHYSPTSYIDINSDQDIKIYRKKRAGEILKNTQTPVAKYINKRISIPLSYVLAKQKMSPNMISAIGILWAFMGAFCLLTKDYYVLGFLCFQINSILDGSDGEVARFNLAFSDLGKKIDVYCDYVTTILIIIFEAIGYYMLVPKPWVSALGVVNVLLLALIGFVSIMAQKRAAGQISMNDLEVMCHERLQKPQSLWDWVSRIFLFIGRRDFYILFIFILALLGQFAAIHVFLFIVCSSWLLLAVYTCRLAQRQTLDARR
ncbi:MAG: CDP-alcohol phosphatidyltransferase family protein [bacterium]|nr:CDP-alcohol phosphatidyltransferase family protein [bacterium]MBU1917644.1 CDP-alcohol phosphatidyltransferase family protein [bacterium]